MKPLKIGLTWHSASSGNLGVGALTAGNIALARRAAAAVGLAPEFCIISPRESGPLALSGDDIDYRTITGRYMINPKGFIRDARCLDIMLDISAGDSFADIYPDKRFAYMAATKVLPILLGTPLVLSPQTIGPFSRQPHTAIAAWICRRAAAVFARDPLSMQMLTTMGAGDKALQTVDVAFALPYKSAARGAGGPRRIGINVSGLLMNGGYAGENEYGLDFDYPALTHSLITTLLAAPDTEVHLVPHVLAPGLPHDDDGAAADALKARYPSLHRHPDFASASAAKSFISGLDFLVGARMHATIAAYGAGVPVVPISYSRKFEGLYGGLGYPWLVNARGMSTDAALAFILNALDRRAELAADIAAGTERVAKGLDDYVAALTGLFAAVSR